MTSSAATRPVLLVTRPAAGGIRSHLIALLRYVDRSRFDLHLAGPADLLSGLPTDLPPYTPHAVNVTAKPSALDFTAAAAISKLAKSTGAIVHAHGIRAGFVAATAHTITKFPLLVTYHNLPPTGKLSQVALKTIAAQSDATIAVSQAIQSLLPKHETVIVIPNGITLPTTPPLPKDEARMLLQLAPDKFVAGYVGRLAPEKGVDLLLRAARLLPKVVFVIAGSGPERDRLIAGSPSNVRFLGYVEKTSDVFAALDVAVMPSRLEGQGIVALEAMAAGVPVVAASVGGLAETVKDGVTGLLVRPEDPNAIALAIERLTDDPQLAQQLADAGGKWVVENSEVGRRVREVEDVYDRLLS